MMGFYGLLYRAHVAVRRDICCPAVYAEKQRLDLCSHGPQTLTCLRDPARTSLSNHASVCLFAVCVF